jgi:hypothetical protein
MRLTTRWVSAVRRCSRMRIGSRLIRTFRRRPVRYKTPPRTPTSSRQSFSDYPRKTAEIGDVLGLDPFGSKKKKEEGKAESGTGTSGCADESRYGATQCVRRLCHRLHQLPAPPIRASRAISVASFTLADFQKDPGYRVPAWLRARRAVNRAAAARGGLVSGAALKELDRYDQDYASGEFSNAYNRFNNDRTTRFNRLSTLAGLGSNATTQLIGSNQNTTNAISDLDTQAGNVAAARDINRGNAQSDAFTSLGNFYLQNRFRGGVAGGAYGTGRGSGGASNFQYNDTGSRWRLLRLRIKHHAT